MAIQIGSADTYVFGGLAEGKPYPYIVHRGNGKKFYQPGTQGGVITNAYPRSNIGSIHRFTDSTVATGNDTYYTTATTQVNPAPTGTYPSHFGLGFDNRVRIPTATRALDESYPFFGAKPLDISIVVAKSLTQPFTINGVQYYATGWMINQNISSLSQTLGKVEMWVFLRNTQGQTLNIKSVNIPVVFNDGAYYVYNASLVHQFSNNNRQRALYTLEVSTNTKRFAFIGAPIIVNNTASSLYNREIEMQYMLCLKNDT